MFGYSVLRASQQSAFFNDLFDLLKKFGVPLEGIHTETGPGVYEAAITYAGLPEAADRAVLFKSGVKEIGHRHGILPSFMAKFTKVFRDAAAISIKAYGRQTMKRIYFMIRKG